MTKRPLWSGRFRSSPAEEAAAFSNSLHFDRRLWPQDIAATRAHARALRGAGILSDEELAAIEGTLDEAATALKEGRFSFAEGDEDIHSAVERFLTERLGDTGARIHAGRSRNDLVATDLRLWCKQALQEIAALVLELARVLADQAEQHRDTLAPGYTHLQRAQPVLLAHLLLAHAFALMRDADRLQAAYRRCDVSPLGAAAFAGTSIALDPATTAEELGFGGVFHNAADAVSGRDFALEFLAAGAILGVTLSRLAEELVLWTSSEFGFAVLDDAYATGSSIMPQKRNPDVAELARAKAGRLAGNLMTLLSVLKGLPLTYNRDLQEDKEPLFDTADTLVGSLTALAGAVATVAFDRERLEAAAAQAGAGAADLAEFLARAGVPFRQAHEVVGKLVGRLAEEGRDLATVTAGELMEAHPSFEPEALELLDPRRSVASRKSPGGTAPERVAEQLATIREIIASKEEFWRRA